MKEKNQISIVLIDDHQIVIDGLQAILNLKAEIHIQAQFTSSEKALDYLADHDVDLILTDLNMPNVSGEDIVVYCKSELPKTKIIVLSMYDEKAVIRHLIELGADGYLLKSAGKDEIINAIIMVVNGAKYFSSDVLQLLMQEEKEKTKVDHPKLKEFTNREIEIIKLIAQGLSSKEIGDQLFISPRTAETHRSNIIKKLDSSGIAGIIRFAFETKLIE